MCIHEIYMVPDQGVWSLGTVPFFLELRNQLPKSDESTTAVSFGGWLTVIQPMMADISSSSATWWALTLDSAMRAYSQWVISNPLEKLRLRAVPSQEAKKWPRTEQRAVTMILAAMPAEPRREAIANRRLTVSELLFRLLVAYQAGGPRERSALLVELADDKSSSVTGAGVVESGEGMEKEQVG